MTLNGEISLILSYFTEFDNGPYFALFSPNSCTISS